MTQLERSVDQCGACGAGRSWSPRLGRKEPRDRDRCLAACGAGVGRGRKRARTEVGDPECAYGAMVSGDMARRLKGCRGRKRARTEVGNPECAYGAMVSGETARRLAGCGIRLAGLGRRVAGCGTYGSLGGDGGSFDVERKGGELLRAGRTGGGSGRGTG
jgi:hypothetical protein